MSDNRQDDFGVDIPKPSDIANLQDILANKNIYIMQLEEENKILMKYAWHKSTCSILKEYTSGCNCGLTKFLLK